MFDIPIALFIFKRPEKAALIIDRISQIRPKRIYIIGDGPRNESEKAEIDACRSVVESHITWDCEVVRDYAEVNRGIYDNIAGGAKRVFEHEETAIFLEDDNMPEISFFEFCREMLAKYKDDQRVLWIMGSNYMKVCEFADNASYAFTQNMLPCGWASWASKFNKYYDGEFSRFDSPETMRRIASLPYSKALKKQEYNTWKFEMSRKAKNGKYGSWDYQMSFSLRSQDLVGIIPKYNQITNIGVDELSTHGGTSLSNVMTERFCGNETRSLEFPLIHPSQVALNPTFEKQLGNYILFPLKYRVKGMIVRTAKALLGEKIYKALKH